MRACSANGRWSAESTTAAHTTFGLPELNQEITQRCPAGSLAPFISLSLYRFRRPFSIFISLAPARSSSLSLYYTFAVYSSSSLISPLCIDENEGEERRSRTPRRPVRRNYLLLPPTLREADIHPPTASCIPRRDLRAIKYAFKGERNWFIEIPDSADSFVGCMLSD